MKGPTKLRRENISKWVISVDYSVVIVGEVPGASWAVVAPWSQASDRELDRSGLMRGGGRG